MIHLREQYWAMEVPADAWVWDKDNFPTDFVINMGYLIYPKAGKKKWIDDMKLPGLDYNERIKGYVQLPTGTWETVCTSKEITEEQAANIVEHDGDGFKDYSQGFHHDIPFPDSMQSYASMLALKGGIDPNINYLILKKVA